MNYKISLAGDLGSGKSTVSKILIERLGAEYYSTGTLVRSIAEKMNMPLVEFNHYMESHPEIDNEIDDGIRRLGDDPRALIIDSRMAWHFTPGTFKVYLSTDIETSAARIMCANRKGEHSDSLEDTVRETRERRTSEQKRYMEQYGVDIKDLLNYSLVVDTTYATPDEVADAIIAGLDAWQLNPDMSLCLISPERLNYPDDEPDGDKLVEYSRALEFTEELPTVEVVEKNGEFYLCSGLEVALAYAFSMATYIPARLVKRDIDSDKFVKMKNSL